MGQDRGDRVAEALRLEERQVAKAWDKLRREAEEKNRAAADRWGSASGGMVIWEPIRNLMDQLEGQIEQAAMIRRELRSRVRELGTDEQIDAWRRQKLEMIAAWERDGIPVGVGRVVGVPREGEVRAALQTGEWAARLASIRAAVDREAESMKEEQRLGPPADRGPTVIVQNSNVGAINLGVVEGDLTATITTLRAQGSEDIAAH